MSWSSETPFLVFWEDKFCLKCMLIIDCHFYVEIYFACLHVQLFNFILYFVQFFVAYWSELVQSHSSKCNENATPLQSIQLWKCAPIQQHIPISLLTGSNTPPSRDILFYLQSVYLPVQMPWGLISIIDNNLIIN